VIIPLVLDISSLDMQILGTTIYAYEVDFTYSLIYSIDVRDMYVWLGPIN